MADATVEEESLISQEDIDRLLDASSLEEAEARLDDPPAGGNDLDELGELSQDDIDNLLNGSVLDADDDDVSAGEDIGGELSQDDIDSLLNGGDGADEAEEDDDDLELISQDDIDRLMSSADSDDADSEDDSDLADSSDDGEDDEFITMDDIKGLMEDEPSPSDAAGNEGEPPAEDPEAMNLDDLNLVNLDLDNSVPASEEPMAGTESDDDGQQASAADPLDDVLDDSETVDISDCLITQEAMDELIRNAPPNDSPADAFGPPADLLDPDVPAAAADPDEFPAAASEGDLAVDPTDALSEDLESDEAADFGMASVPEAPDGDVTQEDIDALLRESDDDVDFLDDEDDILISQEDIDTLLMAADQEDEDVLGGLLDEGGDGSDDYELEDELSQDEAQGDEDTDQVVLESDPLGAATDESPGEPSRIKQLLKSKLILAAAAAVLALGICVPAVYFMFFSKKETPLPSREAVPVAAVPQEQGREVEVASVTVEEPEAASVVRRSGTVVLTDFIVLASDLSKKMTYVYADIAIDYSDQRAYHEINANLSFYRDLIYESIQKSLVSERRDQVTQSDLIWGIEASLKKVLPAHYIEKISFKTFGTS